MTTSEAPEKLSGARRSGVLIALCLATLVLGLDTTVLNVALPTLADDLSASTSQLQWMANSYNLVLAALLLPAGLLGDRFGRKKILVLALAVFGAASLACALATSATGLILARVALGVGAAMVAPVALSLITVLFPTDAERKKAIGFFVVANGIGMPLGPVVGGLILDHFHWGWIFAMNVPIALLAALAVGTLISESRSRVRPGVDWPGILISSAGLAALVYGVTLAGDAGWGDPGAVGLVVIAGVLLFAFVRWQAKLRRISAGSPLVDLNLFRSKAFRAGAVLVTLSVFAIFGLMFTMPQYFQALGGSDALHTGLKLLPLIGGMMLGAKAVEPLEDRLGRGVIVTGGFLIMAAALAVGAFTTVDSGYGLAATWFSIVGVGLGAAMPAAMNAALGAIDPERAGSGSSLLQALRQVGGTVGIALLGTILNAVYRNGIDEVNLPAPVLEAASHSVSAGVAVADKVGSPELLAAVRSSFVDSLDATLWVCAAVALIGAVVSVLMIGRGRPTPAPARPDVSAAAL